MSFKKKWLLLIISIVSCIISSGIYFTLWNWYNAFGNLNDLGQHLFELDPWYVILIIAALISIVISGTIITTIYYSHSEKKRKLGVTKLKFNKQDLALSVIAIGVLGWSIFIIQTNLGAMAAVFTAIITMIVLVRKSEKENGKNKANSN